MRLARILAGLALTAAVWTVQARAAEAGLSGPYVEYYENGRVRYAATFRDGQLVGEWTEYWDNGQVKLTGWAEGSTFPNAVTAPRKFGVWIEYNRNGTPSRELTYVDNVLDGPAVYYDGFGRRWREATYENGEIKGRWTEYFENGQVRLTGEAYGGSIDRPWRTGVWVGYNRRGALLFRVEYRLDKLNGPAVFYHLNGRPQYEVNFLEGNLTGTWRQYYDNGRIRATGETYGSAGPPDSPYEPLKTGRWVEYYKNGVIAFEGTYVENKLHGLTVLYDNRGGVRIEAMFENGSLNGRWTEYYETGRVRETGEARGTAGDWANWHSDSVTRHGLWLRYDRDGKLVEANMYENGRLIRKVPLESVPPEAATAGTAPGSGPDAGERPGAAGPETDESRDGPESEQPRPGGLANLFGES